MDAIDRTIKVNGKVIPHFECCPDSLLLKTNVFFGASNTGKSKILDHCAYTLRNHIPMWFAFSPTPTKAAQLTSRLPSRTVMNRVDLRFLEKLCKRQEMAVKFYDLSNNIEVLRTLYRSIPDYKRRTEDDTIREIRRITNATLDSLDFQKDKSGGVIFAEKRAIQDDTEHYIKEIYRKTISINKTSIDRENLTDDEQSVMDKYLFFNPHVGCIFEDCAAFVKEWDKNSTIREMFYQGRHYALTSFFTFQDDKDLTSEFRKNAFNIFCTTSTVADAYFKRPSNNFAKSEQREAASIAEIVFYPPTKDNYKKLVFSRQSEPRFQYILADDHEADPFKLGCKSFWDYFNALPVPEKKYEVNPFFTLFK